MIQEIDGYLVVGNRRYTNKHGLPPEILRALLKDRYTDINEDPFDESASTLTAPTQLTVLKRRHPKDLRIFDVTDLFWSFLGSVAHQVLEDSHHESMSSVVEQRIYLTVEVQAPNGTTRAVVVSGKLDCYDRPEIRDYKTCKVFKIMKGEFDEWEKGQNIYAGLLRANDEEVSQLNVWAMVTDWKKGEMYKANYPDCVFQKVPLTLWDHDRQMTYIKQRVQNIVDCEGVPDVHLPECSNKEMWKDLKDVVIMKRGGTRAIPGGKFDQGTAEEMMAAANASFLEKNLSTATHEIVERWSRRTRCLDWCDAATVCQQHRRLLIEEGVDPDFKPIF